MELGGLALSDSSRLAMDWLNSCPRYCAGEATGGPCMSVVTKSQQTVAAHAWLRT